MNYTDIEKIILDTSKDYDIYIHSFTQSWFVGKILEKIRALRDRENEDMAKECIKDCEIREEVSYNDTRGQHE